MVDAAVRKGLALEGRAACSESRQPGELPSPGVGRAPPAGPPTSADPDLQAIRQATAAKRASVGTQARGARVPPLVPEHREVLWHDLHLQQDVDKCNNAPQKVTSELVLSAMTIPKGAKILEVREVFLLLQE